MNLNFGFEHFLGNQSVESVYGTFWEQEKAFTSYDIATDTQIVDWQIPLRAESNYWEQANRALGFIAFTKFGFISILGALGQLGIKSDQPRNSKFIYTKVSYKEIEFIDQEYGSKISIFTAEPQNDNESPFRVIIDPIIGNLN